MSAPSGRAREWYESFRGPRGVCGRLAEIDAMIDAISKGNRTRHNSSVGRSPGVHDPTQSEALARITRLETLGDKRRELSSEVAHATTVARMVRFGKVIEEYYLTPEDTVTWVALAAEYDQSTRTLMRWRDDAFSEMEERRLV